MEFEAVASILDDFFERFEANQHLTMPLDFLYSFIHISIPDCVSIYYALLTEMDQHLYDTHLTESIVDLNAFKMEHFLCFIQSGIQGNSNPVFVIVSPLAATKSRLSSTY